MNADIAMLLLKLSAWCALPFVSWPLLARLSASTRHLILTATLTGAVAMPLLSMAAPAWQAPAWLRLPEPAPAREAAEAVPFAPLVAPAAKPPAAPFSSVVRADLLVLPMSSAAEAQTTLLVPSPESPVWRALRANWPAWLWLAGVAMVVLRTATGAIRASRSVREAVPVGEPGAVEALARARRRLDARFEVELREGRRSPVPFAWRGRSAVVVLPSTWRHWNEERLTVVLVHELAHLGRGDVLSLWIGRAAVALWWFHPLVWMAEAWARRECEQAADDAVLLSGSRASDYAEHLLAISRALARPLPSGVALTMSNSPNLKHRLLAILHADLPRRALTRRFAAGTSLAALSLAVLLAGARFAPVVQAQEPEPDVQVEAEVEGGGQVILHEHQTFHVGHGDSDSDSATDSDSDSDSNWHSHSHSKAGLGQWKKAYAAHSEGRYEEAITAFEAAAAAGYRPATSTYNVACGLSLSGRTDEALAALERALELGLDDPEMLAEDSDLDPLRADSRFQALVDRAFETAGERRDPIEHHRYRSAQEALDVLRDSGSEDSGAWSKIGTRLLMLRQLDAATEALDNAARFAREAPSTALYNLACAHALAGRSDDALTALERAIEAGYSDPEHMRRDPDLASLRDEPELERLAGLADALDLGRFERVFWQQHGKHKDKDKHGHGDHNRYSAEGWEPAVDFYRGFVDEHPRLGAGWFNYGYALHYSERFDEAIEALDNARELGFRRATSTYNIACGLAMQNRVDEALASLEEAIELGFRGDLDHDPDLDNLRGDPRFRDLRLEMRLARHD